MVERQDPDQLSLFPDAGNMRIEIDRIMSLDICKFSHVINLESWKSFWVAYHKGCIK